MKLKLISLFGCLSAMLCLQTPAASQPTFRDRLVLDPEETCSTGLPEAGDVIALALKGAKGKNYVIAGNSEVPRLAVRGQADTVYYVFQVTPSATENAVALFSLGHQKYVLMDESTRLFASSEPASALLFQLEEAGDGYIRIRLNEYPFWMRMNENGYLDFRARSVEMAAEFCVQIVQSD